jgi:zinc-ribbon domain
MASFCTSCGSPLNEGQVFCTKCGAKSGAPQPPSAASTAPPPAPVQAAPVQTAPVQAAPPPPAPLAAAPVGTGGGSSFVKILLIVVGAFFLIGAIGVAGVVYVGYRAKNKLREMGLTDEHRRHSPALADSSTGGVNGCKFLSKEDVSVAIGMTVVRAEPNTGSDVGCSYFVKGEVTDLTMKHAMKLNKAASAEMSKEAQDQVETMGKSILQGSSRANDYNNEHPGEVLVMGFGVDENAAQFQMKLNKGIFSRMGPMATADVPNVGDEAFAIASSMLFVRKNDTLVRFTFTQCPCGTDEIVPLAQKVANAL